MNNKKKEKCNRINLRALQVLYSPINKFREYVIKICLVNIKTKQNDRKFLTEKKSLPSVK